MKNSAHNLDNLCEQFGPTSKVWNTTLVLLIFNKTGALSGGGACRTSISCVLLVRNDLTWHPAPQEVDGEQKLVRELIQAQASVARRPNEKSVAEHVHEVDTNWAVEKDVPGGGDHEEGPTETD